GLWRIVRDHAATHPDAPLLQPHPQTSLRLTYRDLLAMVAELVALFETYHVKPGGTVALVGERHWLFHPLMMACAAYGSVLVPISGDPPDEAVRVIRVSAGPR